MPLLLCTGAKLSCTMGSSPGSFSGGCVRVDVRGKPAGTVADHTPFTHVSAFGLCRSLANPQVATATAGAQGVLTPQPCVPNLPAPWTPGSGQVDIEDHAALRDADSLACQWAGTIRPTYAGQVRVEVV